MEFNFEIFKIIYPLLEDFIHHYISYKELYKMRDSLPYGDIFWKYTIKAHLQVATIKWCMVFGAESNETHWKKLNDNSTDFREYLFEKAKIDRRIWDDYWIKMTDFRNEYVAHRNGIFQNRVPTFDLAYKAVLLLDIWMRDKLRKVEPDFVYPTLEQQAETYQEEINEIIAYINEKIELT